MSEGVGVVWLAVKLLMLVGWGVLGVWALLVVVACLKGLSDWGRSDDDNDDDDGDG